MRLALRLGLPLAALTGLAACGAEMGPTEAAAGPRVAVEVAALSLIGVGDVVWDVEVRNGADPAQVVWQRRLASSRYGDGGGGASYVGPCDADPAVRENTVRIWVVGVYGAPVTAPGSFAAGAATGPGEVTGAPLPFENPTVSGPLSRTVTCQEGVDAAARFEVALMRPAQQGFFDVAVSFADIFCSAKFDCEASPLLFDAAGARGDTMVLGLACTGGASDSQETVLYLDDLTLDCTTPTALDFSADLRLDPSGPTGNQCDAGEVGDCAVVTGPGAVDADDVLYQIGVYRGSERLTSGGVDAQKVYWNIALGVNRPAIAGCRLRTRGTGARATGSDVIVNGEIAAGAVYPYVQFDLPLGDCHAEALTFGDPAAPVRTAYSATGDAGVAFAYGFGPSVVAGPLCAAPCENGGACVARVCVCPPGYAGDACEIDIDECDPNPCGAGVCTDGVASYDCACPGGTYDVETTCLACTPVDFCVDGLTCSDASDSVCASCDVGHVPPYCLLPASLSVSPAGSSTMNVTGPGSPATGATVTFTVRNDGETATAPLQAAILSNLTNFDFGASGTGDGCVGQVLAPGDTCSLGVRPKTSAPGAFSGTLTVGDGAVSQVVALSGAGVSWPCSLPWGGTIASGASVTAYSAVTNNCITVCPSQGRTCTNGALSGTYTQSGCTQNAADVLSVNASGLVRCRNGTTVSGVGASLASSGGHCGTGTFDWRCLGYNYSQVCFYGSICAVTLTYAGQTVGTATQCRTANGSGTGASYCTW